MKLVFYISIVLSLTVLLRTAFVCLKVGNREAFYFYCILAYLIYMITTVFRPMGPGLGGTDTWGYRNYFLNATGSLSHGLSVQFYERGYAIFVWLVRQFTAEYRVLLWIVHSFIFVSTLAFIKRLTWNRYQFITILALVFLALDSINIIRIVVAVCISYYVYDALHKERLMRSLVLTGLAISIHISAIILLGMIFIYILKRYEQNFSLVHVLIMIAIGMVGAFIMIHVVDVIINQTKYVYYNADEGIAFPSYIMMLVVFILAAMYLERLRLVSSQLEFFTYLLPVGLLILPLQYRYAIMYRMLLFIHPILFSLIPGLLVINHDLSDKRRLTQLCIYAVLVLFVVYRVYSFFTSELVDLGVFW